jgi:hypothetical protein
MAAALAWRKWRESQRKYQQSAVLGGISQLSSGISRSNGVIRRK